MSHADYLEMRTGARPESPASVFEFEEEEIGSEDGEQDQRDAAQLRREGEADVINEVYRLQNDVFRLKCIVRELRTERRDAARVIAVMTETQDRFQRDVKCELAYMKAQMTENRRQAIEWEQANRLLLEQLSRTVIANQIVADMK